MSTSNSVLVDLFDMVYIINLPTRQDRRDEMQVELEKIGLNLNHPKIFLFPAVRPTSFEGWPSLGAKGCFMSHYQVFQDAKKNAYNKILIIEDDLNFVRDFNSKLVALINELSSINWGIFYGGYEQLEQDFIHFETLYKDSAFSDKLYRVAPPQLSIKTTHCVAFNQDTISLMVDYLHAMLNRPAGDPKGGPMHVDGAYSWFRKEYSQVTTVIAHPQLGYQRSSATDIHDLKWFDRLPVISNLVAAARKLKNLLFVR